MCRIFAAQSHNPQDLPTTIVGLWRQMETMGNRDGFGAAWLSPKGALTTIRSRFIPGKPDDLFTEISPVIPPLPKWAKDTRVPNFRVFNGTESDGTFLIVHARTATQGSGLRSTHPFTDANEHVALIHNGICQTEKPAHDVEAWQCDTLSILKAYTHKGPREVFRHIGGSFACAVIDNATKTPRLVMFRNQGSPCVFGQTANGAWQFASVGSLLRGCHEVGELLPGYAITVSPRIGDTIKARGPYAMPRPKVSGIVISGGKQSVFSDAARAYDPDLADIDEYMSGMNDDAPKPSHKLRGQGHKPGRFLVD